MKGAFQIAKFAGIPVKLHWTFGLLILWICYVALTNGLGLPGVILTILIVLTIFLCVVLHEYGHALTARKFGVTTRDIILSPIGGIARLEKLPEVPRHEFLIAIAGPLVNVGIIILLSGGYLLFGNRLDFFSSQFWSFQEEQSIVLILLKINILLVGFNMIPAFPMDGGRVVRALLTTRLGRRKATRIASLIGQILAGVFFIAGIYSGDFILSIIGVFVFFAASSEYRAVVFNDTITEYEIKDILRPVFTRLQSHETMLRAFQAMMHGLEESFLVFSPEGYVIGILYKSQISEAMENNQLEEAIATHMRPHFQYIDIETPMKVVFSLFQEKGYAILPVIENGRIVGVIDRIALKTMFDLASQKRLKPKSYINRIKNVNKESY